MSVFGVSSYILVTRKGRTHIPFVRGSGFLVKYEKVAFYQHHVVTAAHVLKPLAYKTLYGSPRVMDTIGERHISHKLIRFRDDGTRIAALPVEAKIQTFANIDVGVARIRQESDIFRMMERDGLPPLEPVELDTAPVGFGEPVIIQGLDLAEDEHVADVATMKRRQINAVCEARMTSMDFGPVVLMSTGTDVVSPGMSGCPVLRASNGKCVGMLVASCRRAPPSVDEKELRQKLKEVSEPPKEVDDFAEYAKEHTRLSRILLSDPFVDISGNDAVLKVLPENSAAFIGVSEFLWAMRRTEDV